MISQREIDEKIVFIFPVALSESGHKTSIFYTATTHPAHMHQNYRKAFLCRIFCRQACLSVECKMSESFRALEWHGKIWFVFCFFFLFVYLILLMLVWNALEWLRCLLSCLNHNCSCSLSQAKQSWPNRWLVTCTRTLRRFENCFLTYSNHTHTNSCLCYFTC